MYSLDTDSAADTIKTFTLTLRVANYVTRLAPTTIPTLLTLLIDIILQSSLLLLGHMIYEVFPL